MNQDFELILYPFSVEDKHQVILYRIEDGFEMRFSNDVFSKRVNSEKRISNKNYIEIEVDDDKCTILSEKKEIHKFTALADVYVEIPESSKEFYSKFHKCITDTNIENIMEYAKQIDLDVQKNSFPWFPVPKVNISQKVHNFPIGSENSQSEDENIYCTKIKYGDHIPTSKNHKTAIMIKHKLGHDIYNVQNIFLNSFFKNRKIAKYSQIENAYNSTLSDDLKAIFQMRWLKTCLSEHAYFYTSGPWRHCWIKIGYDPSCDRENYKYQMIMIKGQRRPIQLFEHPDLINEIEKNRDWYLLKKCDHNNGFVSESLRNLVEYFIDQKNLKILKNV